MYPRLLTVGMGDEYPIIEEGTVIEWLTDMTMPVPDLVEVVGMYADEDGNVQLRIKEYAADAPEGPRSIALEDLHEQLEWREWADVTDKYKDQPLPSV